MKQIDRVKELLRLARALDYDKDPNPEHWKTINGAKVHLDKNGNYDGGAGGKFNGSHHYGKGYKEMGAEMNRLANVFKQVTAQKQAQGNTKYPRGALLKLNYGSGMASLPMEIIPLKDGGDKFVMIASMSGPKIREYPGGIEKFLDDMKEKGHTVSERPPKRDMVEPTGGTTREERRNGRVSRMMRRAALYGRPPGAQ